MEFNQQVIEEFRTHGGRVGGMFEGAPLLLLNAVGARTGRPLTTPAVYLRDGDRIVVFASNAGLPKNPGWYHNLLADPRLTVEIGTGDGGVESFAADAEPLAGDERDRLYQVQSDRDPAFAAYQAGTTRTIPVIVLNRLDLASAPERNRAIGDYLVRVHDELRGELAAVRDEVDEFLAGRAGPPSGSLSPSLALHCVSFCDALHIHHTREDGTFSSFEKQFPELAPALDRLRGEHHVVARALTELQALLSGTNVGGATAGDTDKTDADTIRGELTRLAADLEAHFAYEEQQLLPVLKR
jgi:deazaflavin-dependent oxidoreductase (nitroreductase family)